MTNPVNQQLATVNISLHTIVFSTNDFAFQ